MYVSARAAGDDQYRSTFLAPAASGVDATVVGD
jgi:hypothetical protein